MNLLTDISDNEHCFCDKNSYAIEDPQEDEIIIHEDRHNTTKNVNTLNDTLERVNKNLDEEDIDKYMLNALSDSSEDDEDTDINDGNDSKTIQVPNTIPREENPKKIDIINHATTSNENVLFNIEHRWKD